MVCEASFSGYIYVNLPCYGFLSQSQKHSQVVFPFIEKLHFRKSNTFCLYFEGHLLLLYRGSGCPGGKYHSKIHLAFHLSLFGLIFKRKYIRTQIFPLPTPKGRLNTAINANLKFCQVWDMNYLFSVHGLCQGYPVSKSPGGIPLGKCSR